MVSTNEHIIKKNRVELKSLNPLRTPFIRVTTNIRESQQRKSSTKTISLCDDRSRQQFGAFS